MMRQFELVEQVKSYDPNADEDALNRAYVYSMKAHVAQLRASRNPYFSHPVEVAGILAQMKLDAASIVTGLLHDTVEDTAATLDDIDRVFGPALTRLVDGVTKLSRIELQSDQTKQAENFRKLVLAMSADIGVVPRILAELHRKLEEGGVPNAVVSGREKSAYSIWRKMQRKNVAFEQLADLMAFRVLVDDVGDCYHALGIIHSAYHVVPGRFKDFISTPKPNNYRSLHTGVIGPEQQRIEVQIRTREMHDVAELGVAAHWTYKHGAPKTEGPQYRWLRELLDILD